MDSLQSMLTMEKKCKNECFLSFVVKIFSSPIHVTKNHFQKWSSWYEKKKLKILGRRDRLLQLIKERKSPNNVPKNYTLSRSWINMLLIISSYSIDIDTIQQSEQLINLIENYFLSFLKVFINVCIWGKHFFLKLAMKIWF